jgi:hypothetical protein
MAELSKLQAIIRAMDLAMMCNTRVTLTSEDCVTLSKTIDMVRSQAKFISERAESLEIAQNTARVILREVEDA